MTIQTVRVEQIAVVMATLFLAIPGNMSAETVSLNGHQFSIADGYSIELACPTDLVQRPIVADFDEAGRLYVAESSGTNVDVNTQLAERPHWITRLEDTNGDGTFDRKTTFADKMMFPEGAMWYRGSLYVGAPPSIWKLTDTDDDGVADEREEWFNGQTLTGCANDLHGPYHGPDGFIYWCKGAFAEQTHELDTGAQLKSEAAHIFRCRPDGSSLQVVMTGGMDNPVEIAFTNSGEPIFTTTFFQHPGGGQRDGLVHAIYGGVYGKPHSVLDGHVRTGDLMPVLAQMGAAAPSGLVRDLAGFMDANGRDVLFAAQFNKRTISSHVLVPHQSSYQAIDAELLVSDSIDFHPTDVFQDADGSLLVVDTGGWYKLCCPTSQLHKPEVLGAIYRIRRNNTAAIPDPRGVKLAWKDVNVEELSGRLADPRHAVRERTIDALAKRGDAAVDALRATLASSNDFARVAAIWSLTRIDTSKARSVVREFVGDKDSEVALAAIHSTNLWRDEGVIQHLSNALNNESPLVRRRAIEGLGRLKGTDVIKSMLSAVDTESDRQTQHALSYALIEMGDSTAIRTNLADASDTSTAAALIALDQLGNIRSADVVGRLTSDDESLRSAAMWIANRHPDWSPELVPAFRSRIVEQSDRENVDETIEWFRPFLNQPVVHQLLGQFACDAKATRNVRESSLLLMAECAAERLPDNWDDALSTCLQTHHEDLTRTAVGTCLRIRKLIPDDSTILKQLVSIAETSDDAVIQVAAASATASPSRSLDAEIFAMLLNGLTNDEYQIRSAALSGITNARLTPEQLLSVASIASSCGPIEINAIVPAYQTSASEPIVSLLDSLANSAAVSSVNPELLKPFMEHADESVKAAAEHFLKRRTAAQVDQTQQLTKVKSELPPGDIVRGQTVFNSAKAACITCHEIGYRGGSIGPDLTRIGQIRTQDDLLESILFPSLSLVRSYEPMTVVTTDGRQISGLMQQHKGKVIVTDRPDHTVEIDSADVEQIVPSMVSIMPAGVEKQLTRQELSDLLEFLTATRWR